MKRHLLVEMSRHSHRRRGSLFHYYMVYLLLTSMLLMSTGICLHSIIEADRRDLQESWFLRTLVAAEKQLRSDIRSAINVSVQDGRLVAESSSEMRIWTIEPAQLIREVRAADELQATQQFRFKRQTQLSWDKSSPDRLLLNILEAPWLQQPAATGKHQLPAEGDQTADFVGPSSGTAANNAPADMLRHEVQLVLWMRPQANMPPDEEAPPAADLPSESEVSSDAAAPGDSAQDPPLEDSAAADPEASCTPATIRRKGELVLRHDPGGAV